MSRKFLMACDNKAKKEDIMSYHFARLPILLFTAFVFSFVSCASTSDTPQTPEDKASLELRSKWADELSHVDRLDNADIKKVQAIPPLAFSFDNLVFNPFAVTEDFKRDYPNDLKQFESSMMDHLKLKKTFENVSKKADTTFPGKTVYVDGKILDMRIASENARFWGGALAGTSFMNVYIELTDASTKEIVHQKIVTTQGNPMAAAWSFGASDRNLTYDMGKIVGEYLFTIIPSSEE